MSPSLGVWVGVTSEVTGCGVCSSHGLFSRGGCSVGCRLAVCRVVGWRSMVVPVQWVVPSGRGEVAVRRGSCEGPAASWTRWWCGRRPVGGCRGRWVRGVAPRGDVVDVAGGNATVRRGGRRCGAWPVALAVGLQWRCVGCGRRRGLHRHRSTRWARCRRRSTAVALCRPVRAVVGFADAVGMPARHHRVVVGEHTDLRHPLPPGPPEVAAITASTCNCAHGVRALPSCCRSRRSLGINGCVERGVTDGSSSRWVWCMPVVLSIHRFTHDRARCLSNSSMSLPGRAATRWRDRSRHCRSNAVHTQVGGGVEAQVLAGRRTRHAVRHRGGGSAWASASR